MHGPHTAFTSERGFRQWMEERGLDIAEPLTPRVVFDYRESSKLINPAT